MQKLAILGGTFNPIHWGHLLMAETALSQLKLDQVIWVPTYRPPHRSTVNLVRFEQRLEMIQQAIASHPAFILSTVELNRPGLSYAIDTLVDLKTLYRNSQWYWIIGLDAFQSLPHWYRRQELAAQCQWLVAPRFVHHSDSALSLCQQVIHQLTEQSISLHWHLLQMPLMEISSSLIRQYCGDRRSIRYLVPEPVRLYINHHCLYQTQQEEK